MARIVKWTEAALTDVQEVVEYLAMDSRRYAAAFLEQVKHAAQSRCEFPESGSIVPEFDDSSIREVFVSRYRLIFQVADEEIRMLALIHGARDLKSVWNDSERN